MLMASSSFYCCFVFPYLIVQHPSTYKRRESRHPRLHHLHSLGPAWGGVMLGHVTSSCLGGLVSWAP